MTWSILAERSARLYAYPRARTSTSLRFVSGGLDTIRPAASRC